MLFLSEREVTSLLPIGEALRCLQRAFVAQSEGKIHMPLRILAQNNDGLLGAMPATITTDPAAVGAKLVTFFPGNAGLRVPTHQALVVLFAANSGQPIAVMDGRYITEIRTAATSALATKALARPGSRVVAMLGTGVQARAHIEALAEVMDIEELRIWGRTALNAQALADFALKRGLNGRVCATSSQACHEADVICTVTSSRDPVIQSEDVRPGVHINAVGFAGPTARELPGTLMARARIVVDSLDGAFNESGNIMLAVRDGLLKAKPEVTLLCDVLAGQALARKAPDDITIFDSLGTGIEDVACARYVYERAKASGVGTALEL